MGYAGGEGVGPVVAEDAEVAVVSEGGWGVVYCIWWMVRIGGVRVMGEVGRWRPVEAVLENVGCDGAVFGNNGCGPLDVEAEGGGLAFESGEIVGCFEDGVLARCGKGKGGVFKW